MKKVLMMGMLLLNVWSGLAQAGATPPPPPGGGTGSSGGGAGSSGGGVKLSSMAG